MIKTEKPTGENHEEFLEFINSNKNIIYKVCLVYSNHHTSRDDLFQEVVLNLWSSWPKFRGECKVQTWVYRIALNTCITFLRKSRSKPHQMPLTQNIEAIADESKIETIKELYRLISTLGKMEKAIVLLHLEERSHEEIASITGLSKSNVAVKLFRIREKLKQQS